VNNYGNIGCLGSMRACLKYVVSSPVREFVFSTGKFVCLASNVVQAEIQVGFHQALLTKKIICRESKGKAREP
jgi:hypothetical protein